MTYFPNVQSLEVEYTSSQTDALVISAGSTQQLAVTLASAHVDEGVTVTGVGFRMGFGSPSTPTTTGVILSHAGLMPGQETSRGTGAGVIGTGDFNEDLRVTCENPTGGAIRFIVSYFILESA